MRSPAHDDAGHVLPAGLTASQREAIVADDALLCVLAGAGTGKTRVLTLRVARRIHEARTDADHVLVCTFSRKAADELRRRLWTLDVGGVAAGTFHRTALALLRQHRADNGRPAPSILSDRRSLLATVLGDAGPPRQDGARRGGGSRGMHARSVAQADTEIGWAKAQMVGPDGYPEAAARHRRRTTLRPDVLADVYARYEEARRGRALLDLDDLLLACAETLAADPAFAEAVRWRYRHLYVDEMQDVNPAQFRLLTSLLGDVPDLFVVGDPNQSVYGWNGADPSLLGRLPELLPGTRVIRLDENHRSSPQVVTVAAAALGLGSEGAPTSTRADGPLPVVAALETDADEAEWVARQVWLAHRPGRRWSNLAVLARTNAQLEAVAVAFDRARIPHQLAGGDLGPASDVRRGGELTGGRPGPGAPWAGDAGDGDGDSDPVDDEGDHVDARDDGGDNAEPAASAPGSQGSWRSPAGSADTVTLATFHRAKGLQWSAVFVIGVADGIVPISSARTAAAKDEERRLLYVAMTRAEDEVACTWARYRDPAAAAAGKTPRRPSPWLDAVDRAGADLAEAAAPADPDGVAERLAELRSRLATGGPALG